MNRLAFINMLKKELSLWLFAKSYNYTLVCCSIIPVILGFKSFEYINQILTNSSWMEKAISNYIKTGDLTELVNFSFVIGTVFVIIVVISCFTYANIKFLKHYSPRNFEISRSGKITDDICFITILTLVGGVFNIIIQYFIVSDWLYRIISAYLVQTTLLYFMLKMNCCGYKVIPIPSQSHDKKRIKEKKKKYITFAQSTITYIIFRLKAKILNVITSISKLFF
ncbi:hypothetical protein [Candidatus Tisiphia endosymbiont of Nedyus quadrimaculatus]|uniref:hypothetical protein n=1 Tax=Candidatus Tisiphia endosymbiont of Nedyus quadrimaculatus TaxID=3139332 RepID=UPI00345E8F66